MKTKMDRALVWQFLVCMFYLAMNGSCAGAPADLFEAFMENPPVIKEIVFEKYWPGDRTNLKNDSIPKTTYLLARWQPNAYFINQADSLPEALGQVDIDHPLTYGRYDSNYWHFVGRRHKEQMTWDDAGDLEQQRTNVVFRLNSLEFSELQNVLNFGVRWADIGSINWKDDRFDCYSENTRNRNIGTLIRDDEGRAKQLQLHLIYNDPKTPKPREFDWQIDYFYETNIFKPFLPNRFVITASAPGLSPRKIDQITILSLVTNRFSLRPEFFGTNWINSRVSSNHIVTVGTNKFLERDGRLIPLKNVKSKRKKNAGTWPLIAGVGIGSVAVFCLVIWARKKKNANR